MPRSCRSIPRSPTAAPGSRTRVRPRTRCCRIRWGSPRCATCCTTTRVTTWTGRGSPPFGRPAAGTSRHCGAAVPDPPPCDLSEEERLPSLDWALRTFCFPDSQQQLARARERLKFDELFTLELGGAFRKRRLARQERGVAHATDDELVRRFIASLPFELTDGQRRALDAIRHSMGEPHPMNLLLQGDVGSGKTVVALAACMIAVESGHQAAIMAPTEVLAGQHARNTAALLEPIGAVRFAEAARRTAAVAPGQESLLME